MYQMQTKRYCRSGYQALHEMFLRNSSRGIRAIEEREDYVTPADRLIRTKEETIRLLQEQMRDTVKRIIKLRGEIRELRESHES